MACKTCGITTGCGCNPPATPPQVPCETQRCNELPSQLITCFTGQSLPPEFPTDGISVTALSTGNPGDVLTTSPGPVVEWKPPVNAPNVAVSDSATIDMTLTGSTVSGQVIRDSDPANMLSETPLGLLVLPMNCTEIKTAIETGACIPDGVVAKTIGFSAGGGLVKATPSTGGGVQVPATCSEVKTALEGTCIPAGTASTYLTFNASGQLVKAPPPSGGGPALDCTGFQSLLGGCPPIATEVKPLSFIALSSTGEPQKFPVCPIIKAVVNRSADPTTGGCLDDLPSLTKRVLGYDETTKEAKWVLAQQRYIAECRGAITVNQQLSTTPNALNDVNTFWNSVASPTYERGLRGGASWFSPASGRFTIGRPGWYRVSFTGLMVRVKSLLAANTIGHIYAGITVSRAAGTIDGTPYPALVGILRTGESPIVANGKNQDFVFSGEYYGPLNTGDQLWIRVVCTNLPDATFAFTQLEVLDDGKGSFVLSEESTYMTTL